VDRGVAPGAFALRAELRDRAAMAFDDRLRPREERILRRVANGVELELDGATSVSDQHAGVRSLRQSGGVEHAVPHPVDVTVVVDGGRHVGQKPSDRRHRTAAEALLPIGRSAQRRTPLSVTPSS
jgi:hypothetical protein